MPKEEFEWKSAGSGPRYKVTLDDTSIAIEKDGQALSTEFNGIARIFIQPILARPTSYMLHVDIIDAHGRGVAFHDSGYGPPDADARACRDAAAALLRRLMTGDFSAAVYQGPRPDKPARFLVAGVVLLTFVALVWAVLALVFQKPDQAQGLAIGLSLCFIFGTIWSFRRARRQTAVDPHEMLRQIEDF